MADCDIVLLDVEGTTTPISFVKDTLFPYVSNHVEVFLQRNWGSPELEQYIDALRQQASKDVDDGFKDAVLIPKESEGATPSEVQDSIISNIRWQMSADRKIGALKSFQGYMWEEGYKSGELLGVIYDDVPPALEKWTSEHNMKVHIYSSGSIAAQKLIFKYSDKGDLLPYISGHFDTTIGSKVSSDSYIAIAKTLDKPSSSILFISDNIKEIQAAKEAGFKVIISERPGNAHLELTEKQGFQSIQSFDQIRGF